MSESEAASGVLEVVEGNKTTHITLVMPWDMGYWWDLIKSGLTRMEHHFVTNDDPIGELYNNLMTGKLYAYMASEITDGDMTKPNPMAMVVLGVSQDVGTNGRALWIYTLYAFQRPLSRELLDKGRAHIEGVAKEFKCTKIMAQIQDKDMLRYVRAQKWFDNEVRILTAEVV